MLDLCLVGCRNSCHAFLITEIVSKSILINWLYYLWFWVKICTSLLKFSLQFNEVKKAKKCTQKIIIWNIPLPYEKCSEMRIIGVKSMRTWAIIIPQFLGSNTVISEKLQQTYNMIQKYEIYLYFMSNGTEPDFLWPNP